MISEAFCGNAQERRTAGPRVVRQRIVPRIGARGIPIAVSLLALAFGLGACGGGGNGRDLPQARPASGLPAATAANDRDGGRATSQTGSDAGNDRAAESPGWSVLLERFEGPDAQRRAAVRVNQLAPEFGPGLRVRAVDGGAVIVLGSHADPGSPAAQEDADRVQAFTLPSGVRPFARAFMIPPPFDYEGGNPRFNLANAAAASTVPVKYTLQIEQYDATDRALRARLAEERVLALRRQGERAFYFHGPRLSVVTIGLFGDADYDADMDRPSERLVQLKERYERMLLNGRPFRVGSNLTEQTPWQESVLVRVPNAD